MHLSIVVPCHNEESVLHALHEELTNYLMASIHSLSYEIILVNDGSRDKTQTIMEDLAAQDDHVKYIQFSRNFGKESSMLAGLTYASGDAVIIMDADLQHPPALIDEMVTHYLEGYDQVIAKRTRDGDKVGRTFFSRLYYKLVNSLTDVRFEDGVGDFRLLSRQSVDALLSLQEYNRFSKGLFSWIGFKQKIIEYKNQNRIAGESKWRFGQLLDYGIQGVLSFNDKPLRICFNLGLTCIAVSLLYILWTFIQILIEGVTLSGYFTTISAILIIGGVQLLSIGVLGEYIGKIYYEVKKRPHYLIDQTNIDKAKGEK